MDRHQFREIRLAHGLTQKALAALLGYHVNYIARLERGDEPMSPRVERLLRALLPKSPKKSPQRTEKPRDIK